MKRFLSGITFAVAAAAALVAALPPSSVVAADKPDPAEGPMRKKLRFAQKVLEGVTVRDFDMIEKNAAELLALSKKLEFASFHKGPEYTRQMDDFRRSVESMAKAAKDKNIDAAALGYLQLTMNCVNCHNVVRDLRMAAAF